MKSKDIKNLHHKDIGELRKELGNKRQELVKKSIESIKKPEKNRRWKKELRIDIARIATVISEMTAKEKKNV